jgi:Novel STAND NTPase 1/YARHG domain
MTAPPPYVGLRPFEFHEAALFYGRGEHIAEMVRTLCKGHFLAVIGSSGSGKSSLVRAGLLPAIAAGFMNGGEDDLDWRFVLMRPGNDPYDNLLRELLPKLAPCQSLDPDIVEFRRRTLRGGPRGLVEAVADSLLPESARIVVLVDQFEEIFRFLERGSPIQPDDSGSVADRRNTALAFVDMLLATAAECDPHVYVVLTMRSEYLGECEAFLGLSSAISKFQFLTPRMTREQIQDIIERPIAAAGGRIEPQVVTALLNSLGPAQDQLPRVEHALLRMWDRACKIREEQPEPKQPLVLTLDDYRAVGCFETALDLHGEQLYHDLGPESDAGQPSEKQRVAERLFRSLAVRTSQGTLVRRLSTLGEVALVAAVPEQIVAEVVEHFRQPGCNFLVATPAEQLTGETTLDISHESLLRQWKRMAESVTAEANAAAELQRLVRDAQIWGEGNRGFLRQPELGLYARWRERVPSPAWALRYVREEEFSAADQYLSASTRAALAEERKARRRLLVTGVALLLAAIAGASFGLVQQRKAEAAEEEVTYQATQAELNAADDLKQEEDWAQRLVHLDNALKLRKPSQRCLELHAKAAAALWAELRYGAASRAPLIRAVFTTDNTHIKYNIQRMAWSPAEALLATASGVAVRLWSVPDKESVSFADPPCSTIEYEKSSEGDVTDLRFSKDGKLLLAVREKGWEAISVEKKEVIYSSPAEENPLAGDAFSPDGTQVVSRNGGPPRVIPTTSPSNPSIVAATLSDGRVVAWSPKGDRIALADDKLMITVYSISKPDDTPVPPKAFEAFADIAPLRAARSIRIQVNELSFNASGDLLLVRDNNGAKPIFEIWDVNSPTPERKDWSQAEFRAWLPDRSLLVERPVGDGPAVILNASFKNGRHLPINDLSLPRFSADGPEVLFIQSTRNYQVLNLETGYPVTPPFGWWSSRQITARLSLRPGLIASVENISDLAFWDLRPEQRCWHADPPQPPPVAPVWSPDRKWIADIRVDQRVQVAPSYDDSRSVVMISLDEQPSSVRWSEDGRHLGIYSKVRGYIELEWDPPKEIEEPIHELVQLLVHRETDPPMERFELRKAMHTWKKPIDPTWRKLLDWWESGRLSEPPGPNAQLLTDTPSDDDVSSAPFGRDPQCSKWVFHDSNTRPLTAADLRRLSDDELWTARNEIFARRGVKAGGGKYGQLIDKLGSEFHATGLNQDDAYDLMNGVEKANILLIKSTESLRQIGQ